MDYRLIRLRALHSVLFPDEDYVVRKAIRWYSKTFHTPLAVVEEMPLGDIFEAFYEEHYEAMAPQDRDAEKEDLLLSDEDRYQKILAEEADEAEMFETAKVLMAQEAGQAEKNKKDKIIAQTTQKMPMHEIPETDLPELGPIPEDVTMTFISDEELERELDGFGTMTQPPK